jgi:hypothetical protein
MLQFRIIPYLVFLIDNNLLYFVFYPLVITLNLLLPGIPSTMLARNGLTTFIHPSQSLPLYWNLIGRFTEEQAQINIAPLGFFRFYVFYSKAG